MNKCIDEIIKTTKIDTILIDGPHFNFYDGIPHVCINGGDDKYKSIAAASILAKTHRDEWIENLNRNDMIRLIMFLDEHIGWTEDSQIHGGYEEWKEKVKGLMGQPDTLVEVV